MAGGAAGMVWRLFGRRRWGALPVVLAVLAAARHASRWDRPVWSGMAAVAFGVVVLAAIGARRLLTQPAVRWQWVAAGALASAACIWGAVPETGPVILAGGVLAGHSAAAVLTRAHWTPAAGMAAAAVLGWAALSGADGRPWAAVGGALCTGVAPWFALLRRRLRSARWSPAVGPWLLVAHCAVAVLAARRVGVVPDAGWLRVGIVAATGYAVVTVTLRRA